MKKETFIRLIDLALYSRDENYVSAMDIVLDGIMGEIGKIDFTKEVKKAIEDDDYNDVIYVPGEEDDYPLVSIRYDERGQAFDHVIITYFTGDITDKEAFKDEDNYTEDSLIEFDDDLKEDILKEIKSYIEKKIK